MGCDLRGGEGVRVGRRAGVGKGWGVGRGVGWEGCGFEERSDRRSLFVLGHLCTESCETDFRCLAVLCLCDFLRGALIE